ncbi:MAG: efflux RND transporter periplasmic adaptor subunit, partial [Gammaproteobacteria bacterium]|nr:efflux RND transporter periplasmic adaptor subunit [Gammaproteobacteria bacterium]
VDYVYPSLDEKNRTLRVRLRFANDDRTLKPNMFAQVVIEVARQDDVLVVPREALIRTGEQDRVVLALGKGRFKSVAVAPGRMDDNAVEILRGLEPGDTVVVSAQFLLDSESSRSSDFKRMHHEVKADVHAGHQGHHMGAAHD